MKQKSNIVLIFLFFPFITFAQCWKIVDAGAYHSLAVAQNGTLWAWGSNNYGQLGDGTTVSKNIPTQIGSESNWVSIACGMYFNFAIKQDGTLWGWGVNYYGQLGDGTNLDKMVPTQIGTDTNWLSVSAHSYHSLALKKDSTLWASGDNDYGQLGDGTTTANNSFIQIGTSSNWKFISAGPNNSFAIQDDASLWVWGEWGSSNYIPNQFGGDYNWKSITQGLDHILALKQDGSLWGWGYNDYGQVGNGLTSSSLQPPMQIGTDTDWTHVVAERYYSLALKQNNVLWAWGNNFYGQLGDGTNIDKSAPIQIGTSNNWQEIAGGSFFCFAIKQDDSLWSWGNNLFGSLGDGTNASKNVPTAVNCPPSLGVVEMGNKGRLNIYPNPTKEKLQIEISTKVISISVLDVNGRLVLSSNNRNNTINVSGLQSGIYFLDVITEEGLLLHSKFVKE